jgi:hypothetical protein
MKKLLALISFYIASATFVYGQSSQYHFFPEASFWRVDTHCQYAQTNCNEYYYYDYHFGGDTLINGSQHKKIFRDSVVLTGIGGPPCLLFPWASYSGYMGALKEDSLNNRTYFVFPGLSNDSLFYDYNLNIGDTLKGYMTGGCNIIVTSIDSVLIGAEYRRRWNFNTCNEGPGYLIQGIGSDNGLLEHFNTTGFCYSQLICVKDSVGVLYNASSSAMGCSLISTGLISNNMSSVLVIYPNPLSTETTLKTSRILNDASIQLFNAFGQQVKQLRNLSGNNFTMFRDNLQSGIYFLKLMEGNKIIANEKLVVGE